MEIDETRDKNKRKEEVQTESEEKVGRDVHRETDRGKGTNHHISIKL